MEGFPITRKGIVLVVVSGEVLGELDARSFKTAPPAVLLMVYCGCSENDTLAIEKVNGAFCSPLYPIDAKNKGQPTGS